MPQPTANLLLVLPTLEIGGTERQFLLLAQQLQTTRWRPHVALIRSEGALLPDFEKAGIPVTCFGLRGALPLRTRFFIASICREWSIDLAQVCLFGMDLMAVQGARSAGVRAIITCRRELPTWRRARHLLLQRWANRYTDRVVCNSHAIRDYICQQEGLAAARTTVIHNGFPRQLIPAEPLCLAVDRPRPKLRHLNLQPGERVLGCVANFSPVKNHLALLQAFRQVLLSGVRLRLVLIGDGPQRTALEQQIDQLGLGMGVNLLGSCPNALEIMPELDGLILPSQQEGFPNVVLEALALGIPVLASRVGGIPEMVQQNRTGRLFDPDSLDSMANAISEWLHDNTANLSMAESGRKIVRERFTDQQMLHRYLDLYEQLLA